MSSCLIIRSAGQEYLDKALDFAEDKFDNIELLSNREYQDDRLDKVYCSLCVSKKGVSSNLEAKQYDFVILLLDLERYSLKSYMKFIRFAKPLYKNGLIYSCRESSFQSLFKLLVYVFSNTIILKKRLENSFIFFCETILCGLFFFISFFKKIILCELRPNRIGHLAGNNESFLRRKKISKDKSFYIGVIHPGVYIANDSLFKILKRKLFIIKSSFLCKIMMKMKKNKSKYYLDLINSFKSSIECYEFDKINPILGFTEKEDEYGEKKLQEMGIDSWFVCFHARDSKYLKETVNSKDCSYHDFRDCNIDNYIKAMEYVAEQGGYAIRMGSIIEKPLKDIGNSRIIDYASESRSDFMDIYLSAKCKFFVGSTAGLMLVPVVFNVPVVHTNSVPWRYIGFSKRDIVLLKKIYNKMDKRYLTIEEIYSSEVGSGMFAEVYEKNNVLCEENSQEEITAVVKEMNDILDKKLDYVQEDNVLQDKFREIFRKSEYYYDYTARIGRDFLRGYSR